MTGGTGFTGSASTAALAAAGHRVHVLTGNTSAADLSRTPGARHVRAAAVVHTGLFAAPDGGRHRSAAGHHVAHLLGDSDD
ncbi:NAD-dependent epimerase/dehydratase family protein [Saccharothrix longispora]|uniref:NAD-dependent epimerase/dehydratase family protein n=1 Tax=Saccharothrix longispora TaxID=33920 RepID=UPI0028FD2DF5|nr:NAD-dependent epimerase/dehydratase family protein [Saccharothrix longispora]MDU0289322.1 NAD-dependent epimerase/dehydratase family protein [Saccharothrix longispora]